jgi:hypothetical protein
MICYRHQHVQLSQAQLRKTMEVIRREHMLNRLPHKRISLRLSSLQMPQNQKQVICHRHI